MARRTSIEAYQQIEAEGLLRKMLWEAYKHLYHHGPLTAGELSKALGVNRNNLARTLSILRDRGAVAERGTKECDVTRREVILWDVTPDLPFEVSNKVSKPSADQMSEALVALRKLVTFAKKNGMPCPDSVKRLGTWLADRYG